MALESLYRAICKSETEIDIAINHFRNLECTDINLHYLASAIAEKACFRNGKTELDYLKIRQSIFRNLKLEKKYI